jgi:hypothetical protein
MSVTINSEPIDVSINGTIVWFQGDPSATPEWDTLLQLNTNYKTTAQRKKVLNQLTEALCALVNTPGDAETLRKLIGPEVGVATLRKVAVGYVEAVTGFPTRLPSTSPKR